MTSPSKAMNKQNISVSQGGEEVSKTSEVGSIPTTGAL